MEELKEYHFDINLTITFLDSTGSASLEEEHNKTLSKHVHGHVVPDEHFQPKWLLQRDYPFVADPDFKSQSYHSYLTDEKMPKEMINQKCFRFTMEGHPGAPLHHFIPRLLAIRKLFPSFVHFLRKNPQAQLVLRTFGPDGPLVTEWIREESPSRRFKFVSIQDENIYECCYADNGSLVLGPVQCSIQNMALWIYSNRPNDICIRDNYKAWRQTSETGKPFCDPLFVNGKRIQRAIFDDNALTCVRVMEGSQPNPRVIPVNPVVASISDDYFEKHLISK